MAMFYLVRHGDTGVSNMISGRMSGVHLTQAGREQAQHRATHHAPFSVRATGERAISAAAGSA